MPLFRKSQSGASAMSERYQKALTRCRMLLLKEADVTDLLDALQTDDGFHKDVREQIAAQSSRELRMASLLDRLEARGDKPFLLFLDGLREHYRHLHGVLEETLRNIDDLDTTDHHDRIEVSGHLVRKIVRASAKTKMSQTSESADELEQTFEDKSEDAYLDCYSIPLKGRQAREPWIKHESENLPDNGVEDDTDSTYMATLIGDTYFCKQFRTAGAAHGAIQ